MDYYYNEKGQVGVLVSVGFGAGFSTWNSYGIKLALDKRVIEFYLSHKEDNEFWDEVDSWEPAEATVMVRDFFSSIGYTNHICVLGMKDLQLKFVNKGDLIRINEYDGSESLEVLNEDIGWYRV